MKTRLAIIGLDGMGILIKEKDMLSWYSVISKGTLSILRSVILPVLDLYTS